MNLSRAGRLEIMSRLGGAKAAPCRYLHDRSESWLKRQIALLRRGRYLHDRSESWLKRQIALARRILGDRSKTEETLRRALQRKREGRGPEQAS